MLGLGDSIQSFCTFVDLGLVNVRLAGRNTFVWPERCGIAFSVNVSDSSSILLGPFIIITILQTSVFLSNLK